MDGGHGHRAGGVGAQLALFDDLEFILPWHVTAEPCCVEFDEDVWVPMGVSWLDFMTKPPPWPCRYSNLMGEYSWGWVERA